jgi:hypothetical protein
MASWGLGMRLVERFGPGAIRRLEADHLFEHRLASQVLEGRREVLGAR